MGMENHSDSDEVQSARLGVYQLPVVTTRDVQSHQLWLGWQDPSVGLDHLWMALHIHKLPTSVLYQTFL